MNNRSFFIVSAFSAVLVVVLAINNYVENGLVYWQRLILDAILFVALTSFAVVHFKRYKEEGDGDAQGDRAAAPEHHDGESEGQDGAQGGGDNAPDESGNTPSES